MFYPAYVDIGGGLPFFSSILALLLAVLLSFLAIILAFFSKFYRRIKKFRWIFFIIITVFILSSMFLIMSRLNISNKTNQEKVLVLGIDALDPDIMLDLMNEGKLSNFKKLKEQGSFSKLSTTMPPQSPVAWASFSTGLDPSNHGLFDFVKLDKNYRLDLSLTRIEKPKSVKIFGKDFKIGVDRVVKTIQEKSLWEYAKDYNISSDVFFIPNTFPPDKIKGRMISGMGVPDICGTQGTYSFYTQDESFKEKTDQFKGKIFYFNRYEDVIDTIIYGPKDTISQKRTSLPININIGDKKVTLNIQGEQIKLLEGQWSDWVSVRFNFGFLKNVYGICKFYLIETNPLKLYLSAINFDPRNSAFSISYPRSFSKKLANEVGLYRTLGMPYDTKALNDGILSESAFLEQANSIFNERKKILFHELGNFKDGIFVFYFNTLDSIQHTFWRFIDSKHPLYENDRFKDVIYHYYQEMDKVLGKVLDSVDDDTVLIVLSDHGFTSFRTNFHLNSWLRDNGYLYLKDQNISKGREFFLDVDWSKTKAYAAGFNGIYINIKGRESKGIVGKAGVKIIKSEIIKKLENFKIPGIDENIINKVYDRDDLYKGRYSNEAPDLTIGYNRGYRASWQTVLGGIPDVIYEDNKKKWSGTHLIDADLIPGVLFTNKKINSKNPHIKDITPSILELLGIPKASAVEGKNLF